MYPHPFPLQLIGWDLVIWPHFTARETGNAVVTLGSQLKNQCFCNHRRRWLDLGSQWTVSFSEQIRGKRLCYKVLVTSFESLDPTVPEAGLMELFNYRGIHFCFFAHSCLNWVFEHLKKQEPLLIVRYKAHSWCLAEWEFITGYYYCCCWYCYGCFSHDDVICLKFWWNFISSLFHIPSRKELYYPNNVEGQSPEPSVCDRTPLPPHAGVSRASLNPFLRALSFSFLIFIYLFLDVLGLHCCTGFSLSSRWGLLFSQSMQVSHRGSFSCCGTQALELEDLRVAAHGLRSRGPQALKHRLNSCGTWA